MQDDTGRGMSDKGRKRSDRADRLAAELRENLKKRKDLARKQRSADVGSGLDDQADGNSGDDRG